MMNYTKKELKLISQKSEEFKANGYKKDDAVMYGLVEFLEERILKLREMVWDYEKYKEEI